jgi:hypothetical protein
MNKSHLLNSIQQEYQLFQALLADISEQRMLEPGVVGPWSIKDLLLHIVVHQQRMIYWVEERLRGRVPAAPQPYAMPEDELARVNQQIYLENRNTPLASALAELEKSHRQALAMVESASEDGLQRVKLQGGEALWQAVAANTFEHYQEHGQDIRAWLEKETTTPGK